MVKYIDEFRNDRFARGLSERIHQVVRDRALNLMEICGGHTITIFKFGIKSLLPKGLNLISGPGCPVCVTANDFIDRAIELSRLPGLIIASFGDMIRVPGSYSSLKKERAEGRDIRICLSPMDAIRIARENPDKEVVFLGIGFETTAPTVGAAILHAYENRIKNFSVLSSHKTMPQAMKAIVDSGELNLQGFICPGHVSAITGLKMYEPIARDYGIPCVVSGFEPTDMLQSILMLVEMIDRGEAKVRNQYKRGVRYEGNQKAQGIIEEVFEACDMPWRGLGVIPGSGLAIREKYASFDALKRFPVEVPPPRENKACICGEIMRGIKIPTECKLFGTVCTPEDPKGSCMVSDEGSCATYYKYAGNA